MAGYLDELDQAFLTIDIGQGPLVFQIDKGYSGTLVVSEELFDASHDRRDIWYNRKQNVEVTPTAGKSGNEHHSNADK